MTQNTNADGSKTISEYLDDQTARLEQFTPSGTASRKRNIQIYIAALIAAFAISYGYANISHSMKIKRNAKLGAELIIESADDFTYENAYWNYQNDYLGNDISTAKNGGYTLALNGYYITPNADNSGLTITHNSISHQLQVAGVTGLNVIGKSLYYICDGKIHACNVADGSNDVVLPTDGMAANLIAVGEFLFYIDTTNSNTLMRISMSDAQVTALPFSNIKAYVIVGNEAIYLTYQGELYKTSKVTGETSSSAALLANNISDFQYNGDIIALNGGNLISFETDKKYYRELVVDQSVVKLEGASYQHVYYLEDGSLFDLNTNSGEIRKITDAVGVVLSIDNVNGRIFATRKVRNGDFYAYDNSYLN